MYIKIIFVLLSMELENSKTNQETTTDIVEVKKEGNTTSLAVKEIESFEQAERLADWIAESPMFNSPFKEAGKDENGNTISVVNKNAIVTCLLLGNELGFSPMIAITFGRALNREAAIKVERGRAMGLNPMAAMQNIYVFSTSKSELVYTGIHVVNKVLTDCGVKREILEDGTKPHYYYRYCKKELRNEEVDYNETTKNDFVIINDGHSEQWIDEQVKAGKIAIVRYSTRRALVRLTRGDEVVAIPYTLRQAIDADLYAGIKSDGTESKGKANWNAHPETHLIKMSIMLGGRIIASDKLNGIYEEAEISQIIRANNEDIEEAQYVEAN